MSMVEIIIKENKRHNCKGKYDWPECCVCGGRIHLPGCTTKKNKYRDCCYERHKMLHDQGQTVGIYDSSVSMLGDGEPW